MLDAHHLAKIKPSNWTTNKTFHSKHLLKTFTKTNQDTNKMQLESGERETQTHDLFNWFRGWGIPSFRSLGKDLFFCYYIGCEIQNTQQSDMQLSVEDVEKLCVMGPK